MKHITPLLNIKTVIYTYITATRSFYEHLKEITY